VTDGRGTGGWRRFGERTVYDNRWVRLGLVDVGAPNGERWEYHVVHLGRIAVALIVDDQDRVLMLWRYRFITEQWGYELLGGLVDVNHPGVSGDSICWESWGHGKIIEELSA
jgi:hypothetical protein